MVVCGRGIAGKRFPVLRIKYVPTPPSSAAPTKPAIAIFGAFDVVVPGRTIARSCHNIVGHTTAVAVERAGVLLANDLVRNADAEAGHAASRDRGADCVAAAPPRLARRSDFSRCRHAGDRRSFLGKVVGLGITIAGAGGAATSTTGSRASPRAGINRSNDGQIARRANLETDATRRHQHGRLSGTFTTSLLIRMSAPATAPVISSEPVCPWMLKSDCRSSLSLRMIQGASLRRSASSGASAHRPSDRAPVPPGQPEPGRARWSRVDTLAETRPARRCRRVARAARGHAR